MQTGEARLSLFLSAEAKPIGLFWLYQKTKEDLGLVLRAQEAPLLREKLELFHFQEDIQFTEFPAFALWEASETMPPEESGRGQLVENALQCQWRSTRFEFRLNHEAKAPEQDRAWELHRIRSLIPRWGDDYDDQTLVLKLGFLELCDDNKGCYAGQEVIERVRTRGGRAPEVLASFESKAELQREMKFLNQDQQPAGRLSKSLCSENRQYFALGFLKTSQLENSRFFLESGESLQLLRHAELRQ